MEKTSLAKTLRYGLLSSLANLGSLWIVKTIRHSIETCLVLIILQIGAIWLSYPNLPSEVPLYYSLPWGRAQLVPSSSLFYLPGLSLAVLTINIILALPFIKSEKFLSICLLWTSGLFSLFCLITLAKIIILIS
ncbi:MAG: hypothetical protein ABH867_02580 [Patescibacteria group bacterium]|nr:hypothetical protein [Patescibacteria group bacterium]